MKTSNYREEVAAILVAEPAAADTPRLRGWLPRLVRRVRRWPDPRSFVGGLGSIGG